MTSTAFTLIVIAAIFHAVWNLAAKQISGNLAVFWLGLCFATVVLAPFAIVVARDGVDYTGLPFVIATGLLHTLYFSMLASAYRHGEMSVVYPLARGSSVAGTAMVAVLLLDEQISAVGAIGIGLVCLGIVNLEPIAPRSS